ncbi:MAG: phosphoribosylformylglycinamidine synthase subunit PurS [Balneolaceae bacterium]
MYKAKVNITLRKSILDPKGKATHHALKNLGLQEISGVRIGKLIELDITADNETKARELAKTACARLLANEVMEDYQIEIEKADELKKPE